MARAVCPASELSPTAVAAGSADKGPWNIPDGSRGLRMLIGLLGMSELPLLATGEWRLSQCTRIARRCTDNAAPRLPSTDGRQQRTRHEMPLTTSLACSLSYSNHLKQASA